MKNFTEFVKERLELEEDAFPTWIVTFKKTNLNDKKIDGKPIQVKARDTREAILKAGDKIGLEKYETRSLKVQDIQKQ